MYQQTAQGLASLGRGGDDTLVHMNQGEVAALNAINQAVKNRPLSINPHTGMPEAMDMTDIMLSLGLAAATIATAGAAGPLAAMAVGAGLGAGKGAIQGRDPLLEAGLGAFSGLTAGVTAGAGAGADVAVDAGAEAAKQSAQEVAKQAAEMGVKDATIEAGKAAITPAGLTSLDPALQVGTEATKQAGAQAMPSAVSSSITPAFEVGKAGADIAPQVGAEAMTTAGGEAGKFMPDALRQSTMDSATTQISPTFGQPSLMDKAIKPFEDIIADPFSKKNMAGAAVGLGITGLGDQLYNQAAAEHESARQAQDIVNQYRTAGKKAGVTPVLPQELLSLSNKPTHFAAGGTIRDVQGLGAITPGYINQQPMTDFYPQSMIPQAQPLQRSMPIRHEVIGYADGGPVGYGFTEGGDVGGGDEGLLHGPGTGQSDGIMGLIEGEEGQEPVRLADGEFVIPADVVAALGDGSTKAGAKALYDMLDRVRQTAYGHTQQMNPVDPNQVMPV